MRASVGCHLSIGALLIVAVVAGCASVIGADFEGFETEPGGDGGDALPGPDAADSTDARDARPAVDAGGAETLDPCDAAGACKKGAVETAACKGDEIKTRTCDALCSWGHYGKCQKPGNK
jgi:hypothetical protein